MLVRGRRLDPRRILRYLFQELIAPWIQIKRLWLRVLWFFTTPIYIGPMWTTSVVSGLIGVMCTILLFKPPSRLEASTKPVAVVPPPAMLFTEPTPPPSEPPTHHLPDGIFEHRFNRTTLDQYWNQLQQTTLVSTSSELAQRSILQPIRDGWAGAQKHLSQSLPAIYRQTAPLWNPATALSTVTPSDQPLSFGGAGESHPALMVSRDIPAESPSEPITYTIIVQNKGAEILEQIVVSEQVSNLDRVEATHPPAEASATALHWRIDSLRPGQERRLAVTLQPGSDREILTHGEVRTSVAVSSSTRVVASPLTVNETPPVLLETPKLVEPASREEARRSPRLSVVAEIPNSLQVDDELSTVFIVTNSGNGDADSVVLTVAVPGGLEHRDGVLVEHRYAHIPAGTTKRAVFKALARTPSTARIDAVLSMGGVRVADWTTQVQIVARPVTTTPTAPAGSTIGRGPIPEDGARMPSFGGTPQPTSPAGTTLGPPSSIPRDRSIPATANPPQPSIPIDSSIPRNRRPVAPSANSPSATPNSVTPPASATPDSSIPKSAVPAPAAKPQPEQPEEGNFVTVPRRQGAGGISGWKRVVR